jgi:hypothetical protein
VSVRGRAAGDMGAKPVDGFIAAALDEIGTKALQMPAPAEQQPA